MKKTFRADNKGVSIELPINSYKSIIEQACKEVLGWRAATKRYSSIFERWTAQGSSSYDLVILYLHNQGYW